MVITTLPDLKGKHFNYVTPLGFEHIGIVDRIELQYETKLDDSNLGNLFNKYLFKFIYVIVDSHGHSHKLDECFIDLQDEFRDLHAKAMLRSQLNKSYGDQD